MSFPGRPPPPMCMPVPPGMPYMPPLMMPVPQPLMPIPVATAAGPQMRPFRPTVPPPTLVRPATCTVPPPLAPPVTAAPAQRPLDGQSVTVFIGNIADNVPEPMMKAILSVCGPVINWKRVQTFGFCEYDGADAALCAISVLHDLLIGDKKIVAKVDAKTKEFLDKFKGSL